MARRFICGFDIPYVTDSSNTLEASRQQAPFDLTPGRCGGYAYTIDHGVGGDDYGYDHDSTDAGGSAGAGSVIEPSYSRFYMRVRAYPASGGSPEGTSFWHVTGDGDFAVPGSVAVPSLYAVLLSGGTIKFYSAGADNAYPANLMGTISTPLSLNVWYRVNIYCQFNSVVDAGAPPDISNATFTVQIAEAGSALPDLPAASGQAAAFGGRAFYFGGSSVPGAWEGGINEDTNDAQYFGIGCNIHVTGNNGGTIDIDDWVIDDAVAPGEGFVTLHRPIAAGTYSEWANNSFRYVRALPNNVETDQASNGVSTRLSFTMETLASRGVGLTGVIKSVKVAARMSAPRNGWAFGLRQNSTDNYNPAAITDSTAAPGWLVDRGTLPIEPTDTLEVILRDGTGAGSNATCDFACLMVDVEQAAYDPVADAEDDIQIYEGTFVGAGAFLQDVSVPFAAAATPNFIVVKPDNNGGAGGWWHSGMGEHGDGGLSCIDADRGVIAWVESNSFTIRGGVEGVGDSGETNRFFAISDPTNRLGLRTRWLTQNVAGQIDGRTITLSDTAFTPEAIFVGQYNPGFNDAYYRGPGYIGDLTGLLDVDTAATANIIQTMGLGNLTIGTWVQGTTSRFGGYALRTTGVFNENTLCDIGSYTGDGTASRVIPLDLTGSTAAAFVLVIPHNTTPRCCRFGSQAGTGSYRWNSATLNTTAGIVAFTTASFTVTTGTPDLNASGVIYDYIAFGVGADGPDPPIIILPPIDYPDFPYPGDDGALCEDCGCRMEGVPPESRLTRVPPDARRLTRVPPEVRKQTVVADSRLYRVLREPRITDVECA